MFSTFTLNTHTKAQNSGVTPGQWRCVIYAPLGLITYFTTSPYKIKFIQRWKKNFAKQTDEQVTIILTECTGRNKLASLTFPFSFILASTVVAL